MRDAPNPDTARQSDSIETTTGRRGWLWWVVAVILIIVAVLAWWWWRGSAPAPPAEGDVAAPAKRGARFDPTKMIVSVAVATARNVDMPVLNIYAQQDHLVPPSSSKALQELVGSDDYSELSFMGGHIGIYVSSRAQREVPGAIHDWLAQRAR